LLHRFDYFRPESIGDVVDLLGRYGEDAKVMGGGTDLLVAMREGVIKPRCIIDIKGIKELRELAYDAEKGLKAGATVTLNDIVASDVVDEHFHILHEAASLTADHEIRNRATLAGNICNASPAADTAPALLVLDAKVQVVGGNGGRIMRIQDFFTSVKRTALRVGEFVTAVEVPNQMRGARGIYLKQRRIRGEDLAVVGVAALAAGNPQAAEQRQVRVALSSVAPTPLRVFEVEEVFRRDRPLGELIEEAVSAVLERVSPISDLRGSREFRLHLAEALTRRALQRLLGVGEGGS